MLKPIKPFANHIISSFNWMFLLLGLLVLYSAVITTIQLFRGSSRKIAYVNSGELLKKYNAAIDANRKFEEESKKWQENINTLQAELDSLNFLFVKEGNNWSSLKKKEVAGFAKKREGDLQRYTQAVQQKASSRQQELLQPVLADINNGISDYAGKKGYAMVLGTTDGNIVYADKATDITEEVLKALNQ